jgi:hypothetical protein
MRHRNNGLKLFVTLLYLSAFALNLCLLYLMVIVNPDMGMGRFIQIYWPIELIAVVFYGIGQLLFERYFD